MNKAIIFDIEHFSLVDGPGIRTTVFFKGCNLHCAWCHNPESQSANPQRMFYKDKCIDCGKCKTVCPAPNNCTLCGKCAEYCPTEARKICGKEYTVDEIYEEIAKDISFYDHSAGGVTFSGGECMLQIDFLYDILKKCKSNGIHTAVDTAGHIPFDRFKKIASFTDLFLYDIKIFDSEKHKSYTGIGNELIFENLKKLFAMKAKLWIRIPVIAGINDTEEEIRNIKTFIFDCGIPEKTELLPYHSMGENKYFSIGKKPPDFKSPEPEEVKRLQEIFSF